MSYHAFYFLRLSCVLSLLSCKPSLCPLVSGLLGNLSSAFHQFDTHHLDFRYVARYPIESYLTLINTNRRIPPRPSHTRHPNHHSLRLLPPPRNLPLHPNFPDPRYLHP